MKKIMMKIYPILILLYRNVFNLFLICSIIYFLMLTKEFVENSRYQTVSIDKYRIGIIDKKTGVTFLVDIDDDETTIINSSQIMKNN